ncbi:lysoplasmalogenase-like protein TMEM86A isoform X2 [Pristis pectinata]|uniref:lysoplasmalogenase-like protein TMEM86A isoform X2 n=1 Tax=Pristis pectinata TaxID=685728 RepID=UPI00223E845F|nr:lysoplasmalogenase-like protein TMEM86A isoform X2 [Pristis pectinata]
MGSPLESTTQSGAGVTRRPDLANTEMRKLVPFFVTACIYIVIGHVSSIPLWMKGLSKVLPIICLCIFILENGKQFVHHHHSVRKLLVGLFFSAMGDALLLVDNQAIFIGGAAMFALAHCTYTWAFGFKPLNLQAGGLVAVAVILGLTFLGMCSNLYDVLLLSCYCTLIGLMAWRANAEILFHHQWPPAKLTGAIGAWLFMVSDLTLATNLLCFPVPFQTIIVMTTYYAAQLLITLAIVRDNKNKSD